MPNIPAPKLHKDLDPKYFEGELKGAEKKIGKAKEKDKAKLEGEIPKDAALNKDLVKALTTLAKNHKAVDWEFFFRTMGPKQRKSPSDPQSKKVMGQVTLLSNDLQKILSTAKKISGKVSGNGPDGCIQRVTDAAKQLENDLKKAMKIDMSTSAV